MKAGAKCASAPAAPRSSRPAAAANVALAAELAFNTDLSAKQAIAVLGKHPPPAAAPARTAPPAIRARRRRQHANLHGSSRRGHALGRSLQEGQSARPLIRTPHQSKGP
jgi:hypothetical protein